MSFEFVTKYLFLLAVAIFIFARSLTNPVKTELFNTPIWQSLRYGKVSTLILDPKKIALTVFLGAVAALGIIWLMSRYNENLLRGWYAFCVGTILWQLTVSIKILERFHKHKKIVILVAAATIAGLSLSWVYVPSVTIYNILAVLVSYITLSQIGQIRLRFVAPILIAIALYDLWGVWGSTVIAGPTGMIGDIASSMHFTPPGLVLIPQDILSPLSTKASGMLGVGDLVVPGIVIMSASWFHLEKVAIVGFALGLFVTLAVAFILRIALPATIILNPITLLWVLVVAQIQKIKLVW